MVRDFKYRKIIGLSVIVIMLFSLCSCGKEVDVEYYTETSETASSGGSSISLEEQIGAEDKWEASFQGVGKKFNINAELKIPDVNSISVRKAVAITFTNGEKEDIIQGLEADKVYKNDDEYKAKEYWQEQLDSSRKALNKSETDEDREFWNEVIAKNEAMLEKAPDAPVAASDYDSLEYVIIKSGAEYDVSFEYNDMLDIYAFNYNRHNTQVIDGYEYMLYSVPENTDYNAFGTNRCKLTEEELEKLACDFLSDLGFEGFKMTACTDLGVEAYSIGDDEGELTGDKYYDGAYVVLERQVEGVRVDSDRYFDCKPSYVDSEAYNKALENMPLPLWHYQGERVEMEINETGVIMCIYTNPTKILDTQAENVKILDYSQIQSCYQATLKTLTVDADYPSEFSLNNMELLYYKLEDPESANHYSIVPVWRLGTDKELWIMLNAIDGSFISVYPKLY